MHLRDNSLVQSILIIFLIFFLSVFTGKGLTETSHLFAFALILGSATLLLALTVVDWVFIALIYLMLLSPEITIGSISAQRQIAIRIDDMVILLLFCVWIAKTAIRGKSVFGRTPINKFIAYYSFIFVVSTAKGILYSDVRLVSGFFYVAKYLEYFILFYLVIGHVQTKKQLVNFMKAIIITFAIVNIYAAYQIPTALRVSAPFEGEVGEPNTLGGYQVLMLGIILGLLTHLKTTKWRWPLTGLCVFTLIPFAFTFSRSSYLAIIAMYMTLIFYQKMRSRNVLLSVMIILIILAMFFFPQNVMDRILYTFQPQYQQNVKTAEVLGIQLGPSASARFNDYIRFLGKWREKPFLGVGVTGYGFVDGQYIRTLVELGAIGLMCFLALMVSIFRNTLRIYRNTKDGFLKGLALGFLAGHVGMIFHGITANTFILIRIMEPYWFIAALVMLIPKFDIQDEPEEPEGPVEKDSKSYLTNKNFLVNYGKA